MVHFHQHTWSISDGIRNLGPFLYAKICIFRIKNIKNRFSTFFFEFSIFHITFYSLNISQHIYSQERLIFNTLNKGDEVSSQHGDQVLLRNVNAKCCLKHNNDATCLPHRHFHSISPSKISETAASTLPPVCRNARKLRLSSMIPTSRICWSAA